MTDCILPEVRRAGWPWSETLGLGCVHSRAFPDVEGGLGSQGLNLPSTTHQWVTLSKLIALVLLIISHIKEHTENVHICLLPGRRQMSLPTVRNAMPRPPILSQHTLN